MQGEAGTFDDERHARMKTSTAVGLSILGVAVVGAAGAVVYVFTRKQTAVAPVIVNTQPTTPTGVTNENASKPPVVKEPSALELIFGAGSAYACSRITDPKQREFCLKAAPAVPGLLSDIF